MVTQLCGFPVFFPLGRAGRITARGSQSGREKRQDESFQVRTWKLSSRLFSQPDWLPLGLRGCAGRSENVEEPITWGSNFVVLLSSQKFFLKFFVERASFRDWDQGSFVFVPWYFQRLAIILGWISTVDRVQAILVYIQIRTPMSEKYKKGFCFIVLLYLFEVVQNIFWCPEVRPTGIHVCAGI